MADRWYFAWDGNRQGPFSATQLRDLAELGKLQPRDTVWKEGIERGVLAEELQDLFSAPPAEAPPEMAGPSEAEEPATSLRASKGQSPSTPSQSAKLQPWLSCPKDQGRAAEQPENTPGELTLKGIEDEDSTEPVSPVGDTAAPAAPGPAGTPSPPAPSSPPNKKGRAVAARGAVLLNQDGQMVRYRKKCLKCGHEDASSNSAPIRSGVIRGTFFCPKCRKAGAVEIQCVL